MEFDPKEWAEKASKECKELAQKEQAALDSREFTATVETSLGPVSISYNKPGVYQNCKLPLIKDEVEKKEVEEAVCKAADEAYKSYDTYVNEMYERINKVIKDKTAELFQHAANELDADEEDKKLDDEIEAKLNFVRRMSDN